jgi:hypothetical protein
MPIEKPLPVFPDRHRIVPYSFLIKLGHLGCDPGDLGAFAHIEAVSASREHALRHHDDLSSCGVVSSCIILFFRDYHRGVVIEEELDESVPIHWPCRRSISC